MLGILKNTFKPTLLQIFSKINANDALALPILLYGSEISELRKRIKTMISIEVKYFKTTNGTPFLTTKVRKNFEEFKVEPVGEN